MRFTREGASAAEKTAKTGNIAQTAGNRFHALGRHSLTLLDGLIHRNYEHVLQVAQPFFIAGINRVRVHSNCLHALVAGNDHRDCAAANRDFGRLVSKGFLCRRHVFLHLLKLAHHAHLPTAAKATAVLAIVGTVNIPIIKFSVDWWNSLHQPASVFRMDGPTIHSSILTPLLVMGLAYTVLFLVLHLTAMRGEILRRRVRAMLLARTEA